METIGLPELKPDPVHGRAKISGSRSVAKGVQNSPLMRAQVIGGPVREPQQQRSVAGLRFMDGALALRGRADEALLTRWRADPYFAAPPPKS